MVACVRAGHGEYGVLGTGKSGNELSPVLLDLFENKHVVKVLVPGSCTFYDD